MRKIILIPVIAIFCIATTVISCKPSPKEQAAQEDLQEAKEDVKQARVELAEAKRQANAEEWQSFKNDMNAAIDKNDARIAELQEQIKNKGKEANTELKKKVEALKEKNQELKIKMESYKNDADSDWQEFKREFHHDTDELGKAIKDLTIDNKK